MVDSSGRQYVILTDGTAVPIFELDDDNIAKDQTTLTVINLNYQYDETNTKWVREVPAASYLGTMYSASDDLLKSEDAEVSSNLTNYALRVTITMPLAGVLSSTLRIKFNLKQSGGGTARGRIYKNGAAIGTEQTTTSTTYVEKSEDIGLFKSDDTIELWLKSPSSSGGTYAYANNFRVYGLGVLVDGGATPSW